MINLKNISKIPKTSEKTRIATIKDFSLELKGGELELLEVASKSEANTLFMIAGGLLAPDSGTVDFITQSDIYSLPPRELALFRNREIGFLFREFRLIQRLNLYDNIMIPELGEMRPTSKDRAETLLRELQLVQHREKYPSELSLFDKQKTALARAMLHMPRLLLANEPTENLKPEEKSAILAILREYADAGNSVIVFSC
jgi:ABC-type lipoprotein export system ATPase subunit